MRDLTIQERTFLRYVLEGKPKSEAARLAGFGTAATSKKMFANYAYKALERPPVREAFDNILERAGLSDDRLAQSIRDGIESTRIDIGRNGETIEQPDWGARFKFTELALKVSNRVPMPGMQIEASAGSVVIIRNTRSLKGGDEPLEVLDVPSRVLGAAEEAEALLPTDEAPEEDLGAGRSAHPMALGRDAPPVGDLPAEDPEAVEA